MNFMATLSVFPGVTVLIEPEEYTGSDWDKVTVVSTLNEHERDKTK